MAALPAPPWHTALCWGLTTMWDRVGLCGDSLMLADCRPPEGLDYSAPSTASQKMFPEGVGQIKEIKHPQGAPAPLAERKMKKQVGWGVGLVTAAIQRPKGHRSGKAGAGNPAGLLPTPGGWGGKAKCQPRSPAPVIHPDHRVDRD